MRILLLLTPCSVLLKILGGVMELTQDYGYSLRAFIVLSSRGDSTH